jgi:hypothetical protein
VWGYRIVVGSMLLAQVLVVIRGFLPRAAAAFNWRYAEWLQALLVVLIVFISALSEYGEQARFVAAMVPALLSVSLQPALTLLRSMQNRRKTV